MNVTYTTGPVYWNGVEYRVNLYGHGWAISVDRRRTAEYPWQSIFFAQDDDALQPAKVFDENGIIALLVWVHWNTEVEV